ncbi:hypothetical protein DSLASN_28560 [Desulfoluna limicola]|uniref:SCP2 domain-containing protein n=1 Tax=Desulfoluna limicola TaxID=2810562 RepID=A0ABM7PJ52_9BACT|nr:hypothetical protein [Desulfoluna limicola]BCS97224.1 hypothetical protein DSLASN_28560 [Desulfoluna limicola]
MKFNLLLLVLQRKLSRAAKRNEAFRQFIKDKQLKLIIKTSDNRKGRLYRFDRGRITSSSRIGEAADAAMVWSDAVTAFKVMSSNNEEASVAALTDRTLQVDGDFKAFAWFSRSLDIMMGKA